MLSPFWNVFVITLVLVNIFACLWLIRFANRRKKDEVAAGEATGHVWDEDLVELNNPLPRWWLWMFYLSIIFGLGYLVLYPGLGNFAGTLGWTQASQHQAEVDAARAKYGPLFESLAAREITDLATDPKALGVGRRLFLNNCAQCHGSDGQGARNFPNLADNAWLWGGSPEAIKKSIMEGRTGMMPGWSAALGGDEGVTQVTEYVLSLSGRQHNAELAELGKPRFMLCSACHGPAGKGNPMLGAPDLTDRAWVHGASRGLIAANIANGVGGVMPAHKEFLGEEKVHILTAYVYSLSANP